ncbi:hypothetical protein J6X13_00480 [Candidatus Saccharibacteria bacterium]|nr:hypothetical protein [Candidatus Saccharibacteria bacterium]
MDRQERAAIRLTIEEKKAQIASKDASIKEMEERKKAQQAEKKAIEAEISKLNKQLNADTKEFEKALRKKYSAFLKELYESGKVPDYFKTIVVEDEHGDYVEILNLQKYNGRPVENIRGCILNTSMIRFTGKDCYLKSLVKAGFKKQASLSSKKLRKTGCLFGTDSFSRLSISATCSPRNRER